MTANTGTFKVLYFSGATVFTRRDEETFPAPMRLKTLLATLEAKYPGIREAVLERSMVTVDLEYVDVDADEEGAGKSGEDDNGEGVMIKAGQEVAIIPPVSAG